MRGGNERTTSGARSLRQVETAAEESLWSELRDRRLNGFKFVRQLPTGPCFPDFAGRECNLVIEVVGSQHEGSAHDRRRDETMRHNGWSVLRFWHADILRERSGVPETIAAVLEGRLAEPAVATDLPFVPAIRPVEAMLSSARAAPHPPFGHLRPASGEKEGAN